MFRFRFFCIACISCFLSLNFVSCQSNRFAPPDNLSAPHFPIAPMPAPTPNPLTPSEKPLAPDVWDVSDIDASMIIPGKKYISFTFDDAPGRTLENIIAVFAAYNEQNPDCPASATLFCNGGLCNTSTLQTLKAAHLVGFEMGNHTQSHTDLTTLVRTDLQQEIAKTDTLLQGIDGKPYHLFRAPFGRINELVRTCVQTPILDWTIDTLDWTGISEENIYQSVWSQRFDGAIVLMHDGYPHTVTALKRLLPALKADGYQVLSISALSKANACPLKKGHVYIRARKNGNA